MSSESKIDIVYKLEQYADSGDVRRVIDTLRSQPSWHLSSLEQSLSELENTYSLILDYYSAGVVDSKREEIFHKVLLGLYEIIYKWEDAANKSGNGVDCQSGIQAEVDALVSGLSVSYDRSDRQEKLKAMFDVIYKQMPSKETCAAIGTFFENENIDVSELCVIIGALTFALSQRYIPSYFRLLMGLCSSDVLEIRARAVVGLMLSLQNHSDRVLYDTSLVSRLKMMLDDVVMKRDMITSFVLLLRTGLTKTILDEVVNDITPDLFSRCPNPLSKNVGDGMFDIDDIVSGRPKLKKDIEKLSNWQSHGLDILYGTFIYLKGFPMFKHLSGWFRPFDEDAKELKPVKKLLSEIKYDDAAKRIAEMSLMCDSDKYSFLLSFASMPQDAVQSIFTTYVMQQKEYEEQMGNSGNDSVFQKRANLYVQDLYRVYNVYFKGKRVLNPFNTANTFVEKSVLFDMLFSPQELEAIGDDIGGFEQYESAAFIYEKLLKTNKDNDAFYDKLAYCYISKCQYSQGLYNLTCAEKIGGKTYWRSKMKATCYGALKLYVDTVGALKEMLSMKPDDLYAKTELAECYKMMESYDDELGLRFEIDYMKPTQKTALQTAECLMRLGYVDRATSYVARIGDGRDSLLLAASYKMCLHDTTGAIECLRSMGNRDKDLVAHAYKCYMKSFVKAGVSKEDLRMIGDIASRDMLNGK